MPNEEVDDDADDADDDDDDDDDEEDDDDADADEAEVSGYRRSSTGSIAAAVSRTRSDASPSL